MSVLESRLAYKMKEKSESMKFLAQSVKIPKLLKFLQYALKFAIFTLLLVVCYIYFMKEAIEQFKKEATTVTERSIPIEDLGGFKSPAIVVCPNPAFKPSISDLHGFAYPTRDLFNMKTPFSENTSSTKQPSDLSLMLLAMLMILCLKLLEHLLMRVII